MNDLDQIFRDAVLYFYQGKGDPTQYVHWDAERCEQVMPAFFYAWRQLQQARVILDAVVEGML